ncbi:MAG: hypothetical protein ACOCTI_04505 [Phycisphaeraceae bacterium]
MSTFAKTTLRYLGGFAAAPAVVLLLALSTGLQQAEQAEQNAGPPATVTVDGEVALQSLMSLADGHLQKIADTYAILAATDPVRSAAWEQVREPLASAAEVNASALYWFALPDGSYWTLDAGRAEANLADRDYFPRVLEGQSVLGDLVVSRATGKSTAIVAVPVIGEAGEVVGVLGASVYLDRLSERIKDEMGLSSDHVFYTLNEVPIVGLHKDPHTIFVRPLEEDDPQLTRAIREILSHEKGVASYRFRDRPRTVHYRKSPVTGWWYAFGKVYDEK